MQVWLLQKCLSPVTLNCLQEKRTTNVLQSKQDHMARRLFCDKMFSLNFRQHMVLPLHLFVISNIVVDIQLLETNNTNLKHLEELKKLEVHSRATGNQLPHAATSLVSCGSYTPCTFLPQRKHTNLQNKHWIESTFRFSTLGLCKFLFLFSL